MARKMTNYKAGFDHVTVLFVAIRDFMILFARCALSFSVVVIRRLKNETLTSCGSQS